MAQGSADDWSNYWQGRTAEETGAALAGAGVEDLPSLNEFWTAIFAEAGKSAQVLDLACGAGSALRHAALAGVTNLTGADYSRGALSALKNSLPEARCVCCSADDTPFPDQSFDYVVSQFGFEYADYESAGKEISRLVRPSGKFVAITHYQGGAIEEEVSDRLLRAQKILSSGFVEAARRITQESYQRNTISNESRQAFEASQPKLAAAMREDPTGLSRHLYQGFQQLFERRQNYLQSDITNWLDGMEGEIEAFTGRMQSMKDAALSAHEINALKAVFTTAGFSDWSAEPFQLKDTGMPGAWALKATRN